MSIIRLDEISLEFGDHPLLESASLALEANERVCLIGRNGAGKTTLFKLITGQVLPDSGEITTVGNLRISQLEQTLPAAMDHTVRDVVRSGLAQLEVLLARYNELSHHEQDKHTLKELEDLQQQIDAQQGWDIENRVDTVITELKLPSAKKMSELSGGWRRRVALGKALISKPDLLLLDEPTNHLDIDTIEWLEKTVRSYKGCVLFITHDRAFLQRLATRIIEIDRGKLLSWPGSFDNYLKLKEQALDAEATANARFDKKMAEEEAWLRQGVKARRKRNEGRKRALMSMRDEFGQRRKVGPGAHISIDQADTSGKKVIRAKGLHYSYNRNDGEAPLIDGLTLQIMRGDRIGLVGNNGVGKSTLLRLLLGELEPQQGVVKLGTNLEVGYFDQLRSDLDLEKSVAANITDKSDYITINGKQRHVIGYLKGFLFSPKRSKTPVKILSGGERNRLLLAKLFTRPTNLLVLDEPTNDLDVETLEVLEDRLAEYAGTLIVVSHDREFLDNTVTSILVFEDGNRVEQYVGGYSEWLRHGRKLAVSDTEDADAAARKAARRAKKAAKKLGYKEQRELDELPQQIEVLEKDIGALQATMGEPDFFSRVQEEVNAATESLNGKTAELETKTERWLELEEKQQQFRAAKKS